MKDLKRAYFRPPQKEALFSAPKKVDFSGPPKTTIFRPPKIGLIFGPKKRPKNGRFLGLKKDTCFRHRRH